MNKTPEQVDEIMESISPPMFRYRWCGAERGPCACMGCVQICSRAKMYEMQTGLKLRSDPEGVPLDAIRPDIREACTITREEWETWKVRHPEPADIVERSGYRLHYGGGESLPLGGAKGETP